MANHKLNVNIPGIQRLPWIKFLLVVWLCSAPHLHATTAQTTARAPLKTRGMPAESTDLITDVTEAGKLPDGSDVTELVTGTDATERNIESSPGGGSELETGTAAPETETETSPDRGAEESRETIALRFTLDDSTKGNITQDLQNEIVRELSAALTTVGRVNFKHFSHLNSRPKVEVEIIVEEDQDTGRAEALNITYYYLMNGGIAGFPVKHLEIKGDSGDWLAFSCKDSYGERLCIASCADNEDYCRNGGTCNNPNLTCSCPEGFVGNLCQNREAFISDRLLYILIAIAGLVALILLLILLCCLVRLCRAKRKSNRGLYGVENVVALHSLHEESDGIAIQTDDSFLLKLSHENGVPPKPGYTHSIMQTNESFLLARSQNPQIAQVKAQPQQSPNTAGRGVDVESAVNNNPVQSANDAPKPNPVPAVQTDGSPPRNIVTV